ncbi:MAG: Suppressor of fused protein (SUFU) [Defluviimonas sp.]|uniref:hypothetical protein n=1 Tax=Albidovulum sp. TaxID=1872424 RepID=UPI001DAEA29F|nr:hypothetical protein [Paracoccaceae bacterium]MCC0063684.1 Suppressor of fused protein (SUFU) [Defluviimonas sp.]
MSWLQKLFGGQGSGREGTAGELPSEPSAVPEPARAAEPLAMPDAEGGRPAADDPRIGEGRARVTAYWEALGAVDSELLTYPVDPALQGAPAWPDTRQAYRVVRTDHGLILASDGLSDPFRDGAKTDTSGFGLELYLERAGGAELRGEAIRQSPEFAIIELAAQNVAGHGAVAGLLDRVGVLSMALPLGDRGPQGWVDAEGQLGVLLGIVAEDRPARIELPFGPVHMVAVTPLRPAELVAAATSGAARRELAEALGKSQSGHRFDPARESLR